MTTESVTSLPPECVRAHVSLAPFTTWQVGGEARYFMMETLREYGLELLVASGEEGAVRDRHASAYLDPQGQLYGEPHQKMRTSLQNSGLQVHTGFKEPSDHLAVVLAYVETSIRRAADVSGPDRAAAAADQA